MSSERMRRYRIFSNPSEAFARVVVAGLFLALAWTLGSDYVKTHRPTDLLLLVGEGMVVVLTCLRRDAITVDRRLVVRIVTGISMALPMFIRPGDADGLISETLALGIGAFGLLIVIAGKLSLGYSFGLLPANRGVVSRGLYRIVRHPIYLGYLLTHLSFLAAHPTPWNALVIVIGDATLIARAFYEEHTLALDPTYARYRESVKWRLVPGVC